MRISKEAWCVSLLALMFFADVAHGSSWRLVSAMPEPRWFHAAGVGSDGRIYAYAGYVRGPKGREYGLGEYSLVIYDPPPPRWRTHARPFGAPVVAGGSSERIRHE